MPILDVNLNNIPDAVLLDEGEKQLRINSVEQRTNVNNKPFLSVSFESLDNPEADLVYDNVYLPDGENVRKDNSKARRLAALCEEFKIPLEGDGGLDTDKMVGCTGFVMIRHGEDQNGEVRAEVGRMAGGK